MRDAFTLFDQVVSFSGGRIRSALIREKLGLVGLEKLNGLAEACAANDAKAAFALIDEILNSGVAIEQFVIDLAGYCRSLLLLKNGVTRESLLGYRPAQFSAKVLETFDSIRLEQALEILLDCYRDIRYSVSPRFELETAVSKLAWLSKWVSGPELKDAMEGARRVLEQSGFARGPSSRGTSAAPAGNSTQVSGAFPRANETASLKPKFSHDGLSLSNELQRVIAGREPSQNFSPPDDEDEDVPIWDSSIRNTNSHVEQVLSVIPGTVID
jgi:DNA polymerase III gamma/tau subunit